jgi:dihydrodipicolinate synthase/N-acetylneuraminate lyase
MIRGVHAAIVTHFDDALQIDHGAVSAEVARLITAGVDGIVVCGTMGEANSLTAVERRDLVTTTVRATAGRVPVCAGVSAPTAALAAAHARHAAAAGADTLMTLPPLLYRADRAEVLRFLQAVAGATELPLMVYNNPEASGVDLTPDLLAQIAAEVPAVHAIKETSGDARRITDLITRCPDVDILVGGDDWALEGCVMGAAGWISGIAVVLPEACVRLWELGSAGDLVGARELYRRLLGLARLDMTSKLVQYFKAALDGLGLPGGPCREPRLPLTADELTVLGDALADAVGVGSRSATVAA